MAGVVIGQDADADAFHAVADQGHGRVGQQRRHAEAEELRPPLLIQLLSQQQRGAGDHGGRDGRSENRFGIELSEGVVARRKVEGKEQDAEDRQGDHNEGAKRLSGQLGVFHGHALLSLRSARTYKTVNAIKPT